MATTAKALEISHQLANHLSARLNATLALVEGFGPTDSNPTIVIGAGSAGGANFVIKVRPVSWPLAKDVFGNTALAYSPHAIEFCTEADPTGGSGADPTSRAQLALVLMEVMNAGVGVSWYETANGTAPTVASLPSEGGSATLRTTVEPSVWRPMLGDQ